MTVLKRVPTPHFRWNNQSTSLREELTASGQSLEPPLLELPENLKYYFQ